MYFSVIDSPLILCLLGAALLCLVLIILYYMFRVLSVVKYRERSDRERPDKPDSEYLPASIVIYSQGDAEHLHEMLGVVLNQDYPAPYEVIVVNEGESADVRDTVSMLRSHYPNLYLTFTPEGVVNLSRKKLALTLGIKASRYDTVVLTTTAAIVESSMWLRRMMFRFGSEADTEIVLGYAYIDPAEDEEYGRRRRAFDFVADSVRWLAVAIAGRPFRGTEYNLAYKKEVFLRNKGFARSLNLHYGDDDIFISEVANRHNTAVELSEDSIVRIRQGNDPRLFTERMLRHLFTERFIRRRPRVLAAIASWLQIIAIACAATAAVLGFPDLMATAVGALIVVAMLVVDIIVWHRAMLALKSSPLMFSLPWLSVTLPLRVLGRRIVCRMGKQKKYTWD